MGFKTTLKRIFGSHDKKEKQPAAVEREVERSQSPEYRDDCSVCRANRAKGLGHHSGSLDVAESHSPDVADQPGESLDAPVAGRGVGANSSAAGLEHMSRHDSSPGVPDDTGLGIGPSGVRDDSGGKDGKVKRPVAQGPNDNLKSPGFGGSGDGKEISSADKDQHNVPRGSSNIDSASRPPVGIDNRPSDLGTPGIKDKNDLDSSPASVRPENLASRPDIPSAQGRSKHPQGNHDHDMGFVGVGRTPGPSTTFMSDTKNAEDLDPFESVPGTKRSPELGAKAPVEESGLGPQHSAQSKNPFRTPVAPTTSFKDVSAPTAVPAAAGGALLGAGVSGARKLGRDNEEPGTKSEGTSQFSGNSGLSPKGIPGTLDSDAARSRTPSPFDRSRDRQAPPTPPLNERERSIEIGMREEIDSQRFDPSREGTPVGGHRSKVGEFAAGGAGAGIAGGAAAAAASRGHDDDKVPASAGERDQPGEMKGPNASSSPEAQKPSTAPSRGALDNGGDVDGVPSGEAGDIAGTAGTDVPPTQRLGVTSAGLAQPQPDHDVDFPEGSGTGADTSTAPIELDNGTGDAMLGPDKQKGLKDPASSQDPQSSTEGQGEARTQRGLDAGDVAGTTLDDGAHIDVSDGTAVPPTQRLGTTPAGPAQEQTGVDSVNIPQELSEDQSHAGALAAGAALGAGAGALGAQEFGRRGDSDGAEEVGTKPTDMMASNPVKLDDEDSSGGDKGVVNNDEAPGLSPVEAGGAGAYSASSPNMQTSWDQADGSDLQANSNLVKSSIANFDIHDQFDERGPCSVPTSTNIGSLTYADEEEIAQEDDHGMIACQRALPPQQTDSTPTSAAKPAIALGAGVGAGALGVASLTQSKDLHSKADDRSFGRPRLYTIPGTNIPITPTEESQDFQMARAPRRMMTIPGTNAPTSYDYDGNFDDILASTGTGSLGAPTVTSAEQPPSEEQTSRVPGFDPTGAGSSFIDAPTIHETSRDVVMPDTQNRPPDQAERPSTTGNDALQQIAEEGGLTQTGIAAASTGVAGLAAGAYGLNHANETQDSSDHVYSSRGAPLIDRYAGRTSTEEIHEPATPSDEEAWTKLPSEPTTSHEGTKDVFLEDSESQYSVESPSSVHQFGEEPQQSQAGAIAALASQSKGSDKGGVGIVPHPSTTNDSGDSRNGDEKESAWLSHPGKENQTTSISNVDLLHPDEENMEVFTGAEGNVQGTPELLSSQPGDRRSYHSQTMPGDWDMETTGEALGDTSAATDAIAKPITSALPITKDEEQDSPTVARDGISGIAHGDLAMARAHISGDRTESAAPIGSSGREDPRIHIAREFAHEQANKGVSTPSVVRPRGAGQTGLERGSFEQALASNERKNMSRTPRIATEPPSALQDINASLAQASPEASLMRDDENPAGSVGLGTGVTGLGLDRSGKSVPPGVSRSESTGVATIEKPYIYKRPESFVDGPFPESAVREELPISSSKQSRTGDTDSRPHPSDEYLEEVEHEAGDYETEDEDLLPLFHDGVSGHVLSTTLRTDPALDKEVISHQEHYSGDIVTHDLIHDQPQEGEV